MLPCYTAKGEVNLTTAAAATLGDERHRLVLQHLEELIEAALLGNESLTSI